MRSVTVYLIEKACNCGPEYHRCGDALIGIDTVLEKGVAVGFDHAVDAAIR
jgi:hypothetical protein